MTFSIWLLKQRKRNDPVGDLARDFEADRRSRRLDEPPLPRWITPGNLHRYLIHRGACDGALDALDQAKSEWKAQR